MYTTSFLRQKFRPYILVYASVIFNQVRIVVCCLFKDMTHDTASNSLVDYPCKQIIITSANLNTCHKHVRIQGWIRKVTCIDASVKLNTYFGTF